VRKKEISLNKWSGGTAHLRTLKRTLPATRGGSRVIAPPLKFSKTYLLHMVIS